MKLSKEEQDVLVISASILRSVPPLKSDPIDDLILKSSGNFDSLDSEEIIKLKEFVEGYRRDVPKFKDHRLPGLNIGSKVSLNNIRVKSIDDNKMHCVDQYGWDYYFNISKSDGCEMIEMPYVGSLVYLKSRLLRLESGSSYHDSVLVVGVREGEYAEKRK